MESNFIWLISKSVKIYSVVKSVKLLLVLSILDVTGSALFIVYYATQL